MPKSKKFIILSITALSAFALLIFIAVPFLFFNNSGAVTSIKNDREIFYLNDEYQEGDPLLTSIPGLEDMITGPIITNADPALGPIDAKINLVVFTDFECSYCYNLLKNLKQIQAENPTEIKLIHKDFPVNNKESASFQAAVAGRCAQEQDKFWEYSDKLYQNNYQLNQDIFINIASEVGLNKNKFKDCLSSGQAQNLILDNIEEANALRIIGIPLIYINEQEILGDISLEELERVVEEELNK